jgi:sialate O-acetylesterase
LIDTRIHLIVSIIAAAVTPAPPERVILKEDFQVLQRDAKELAFCLATLPAGTPPDTRFIVTVERDDGRMIRREESSSIQVVGSTRGVAIDSLPTGGPYTIRIAPAERPAEPARQFAHILVGDIWLLGGQSNMYGIDVVKEHLPALPWLNMLNVRHIDRDAHWCAAVPPIHRIPEAFAAFTLRSQHPDFTDDRIRDIVASGEPVGGIDCSYFFARKLHAESGIPIGLIPCATGGSLSIWDPDGANGNRYDFALHHVKSAGGKIKGLLFFQGEQDAIFGDVEKAVTKPSEIGPLSTYGDRFARFIEGLRADVRDPSLPVIYAQICRHHNGPEDRATAWEMVREAQRRLPDRVAKTHCVPSIDTTLMDGLHLDYDSLKRVGERMARLATPYVTASIQPRTEIRLKLVMRISGARPALVVQFSGVSGRLHAPGRATGFVLKTAAGKTLDWIYKVEFDPARPNAVILRTTSLPGRDAALYYGAGAAPYVNITDDEDMPLPAFGPIALE